MVETGVAARAAATQTADGVGVVAGTTSDALPGMETVIVIASLVLRPPLLVM